MSGKEMQKIRSDAAPSRSKASKVKPTAGSLVRKIANGIRDIVFEHEPGALLGSEDELLGRFGVSRPTFRQAAKLVEQEQLLAIRRGVGGGYFGRRPDSDVVRRITALYLRSTGCTLSHIIAAVRPAYVASARWAVQNITEPQIAALNQFAVRELEIIEQPMNHAEYLISEGKFSRLFAESSGNPLIKLFLEIVVDLSGRSGESVWANHPERIEESRRDRLFLIEAIVRRDGEMAEMAAKRLTEKLSEWAASLPSADKNLEFSELVG